MMTRTATLVALLALWLAPAALAAAAKAEAPKKEPAAKDDKGKKDEKAAPGEKEGEAPSPVHVWSDRIRYLANQNLAKVIGNATIIKKDLRIDAENVDAVLDPETNEFKKIIATGNVHIYSVVPIEERTTERPPLQMREDQRRAICERAEYDLKTEIVILIGTPKKQPMVWINKDQVQADKITFDHKNDMTYFSGRVRLAALTPAQEAPGEGKKP